MSKHVLTFLAMTFMLAFLVTPIVAQEQSSCVALVFSAITQSSTQCATNGIDSACYGHDKVQGSFLEESSPNVFTQVDEADQNFFLEPGDQAQLRLTTSLQTGPFDQTGTPPGWGISVMNVQAGLPGEIVEASDGRGVIYYLFGGVEVEGDVEPDKALALLPAGIEMTTLAAADMRIAPVTDDTPTSTNVMARIPAETAVNADAITPDGGWVRVVFEDRPGWISRATLGPDVDVSDLVEIGPEDFTPMQAFFFRNGIHHNVTGPDCTLASSFLFVQGPQDVPVHLRVHRVDMRLESSMVLRSLVPGDELGDFFEVIPLFGMLTIFPDTEDEILVPPGYVLRLQFGGEGLSLGIEGDADEKPFLRVAGPIRPLTQAELEDLRIVESLPDNILHYVLEVPSIVIPSGIGQVVAQIIFNNPPALGAARRACDEGRLATEVCQSLGL